MNFNKDTFQFRLGANLKRWFVLIASAYPWIVILLLTIHLVGEGDNGGALGVVSVFVFTLVILSIVNVVISLLFIILIEQTLKQRIIAGFKINSVSSIWILFLVVIPVL
ncbi:hypothetical protein [Rahnella sp. PAMC 25559]|uniref:hypothetical protein n=1 Tax=Rahnella sp. PAMC 25559 TaxID=3423225 RepID=UPI003D676B82